jgi:hypothetical protein
MYSYTPLQQFFSNIRQAQNISSPKRSDASGPIQSPSQLVLEAFSLGVKQLRPKADHSNLSSAKVQKKLEQYLHSVTCLHGMHTNDSAFTSPRYNKHCKGGAYNAALMGNVIKDIDTK